MTSAFPLVIVGGGAGGHACAASYREHHGEGPIVLVSADDRLPYFRPALTKELLAGEQTIEHLGLESAAWYPANDVDVRLSCRATGIDLVTRTLATDQGPIVFERLVLATGSRATRPPIPGADDPRVLTIRAADDAARVLDAIAGGEPVLVVGSGFVGCEAAAEIRRRGLEVTMVSSEALPQAERLGADAGRLIAGWLDDLGISMRFGVQVTEFEPGSTIRARLDDDSTVECGWVVLATGAEPNLELAETAGLVADGAVSVDGSMHTGADGVFAVGDIARAVNVSAGRALRVEHWGDAERMGRIAGAVAAGVEDRWAQAPGFWSNIGGRQLKYVAWGDGWDQTAIRRSHEGMTLWYGRDGRYVGVLTHEHDDDLELGTALIESNAPFEIS